MEYLVEGSKYNFSYTDVRQAYIEICALSDPEFVRQLPKAIHLACVICYFKEIPTYNCLSDRGIIHELAHAMDIGEQNTISLQSIRALFKEQLKLD